MRIYSPLLAQAERTYTASETNIAWTRKFVTNGADKGLPTTATKQNTTVLPSATALALAVGTVTPSRQPTLGCDHDREGPRLLKVAQTVQIPLLSSRCRSPIEVIRIDQSSTAIIWHTSSASGFTSGFTSGFAYGFAYGFTSGFTSGFAYGSTSGFAYGFAYGLGLACASACGFALSSICSNIMFSQ